jgi:hypothetical protein
LPISEREKNEKIYVAIFISSLFLFLANFLIQGQIVFSYSDFLGILFKLNVLFWLGQILLIILIWFQTMNFNIIEEKYVLTTFSLLTLYLIGTPFFYEYLPRFEDTWSHSFLSQEIFRNERVDIGISNYEEFPGAFLFHGLLFQLVPQYYVMKFFPPLFYVFGLIVVYLLSKLLFDDRIAFLSSILYLFFNWTIEDNHISPQFLMLNIYFLFMLTLVKLLTDSKNKEFYFFASLIIIPAIIFSHPGRPVFLIIILGTIFIFCKKLRGLPFLLIIIFLIACFMLYNVYQSITFNSYITYVKHFFEVLLTGDFSRTTGRLVSSQFNRQIFLTLRMGMILLSIFFGSLGIFALYRQKDFTGTKFFIFWSFSIIIFSIFVGFALKGEYYEKFVMISSLPLAIVSSYYILELKFSGKWLLIFLLLLLPIYFITKYGNEAFESLSVEKLNTDCFNNKFNTECLKNQEIVDARLDYDVKTFGKDHFTISREELMTSSVLLDKGLDEIRILFEERISETSMDRIFSTNTAGVYR